jgi:hypothetical protein
VAVERASGLVLGIGASGVVRLLARLVAERQALTAAVEKMLVALTPDVAVAEHVCRLCDLDACPQERCPADPDAR